MVNGWLAAGNKTCLPRSDLRPVVGAKRPLFPLDPLDRSWAGLNVRFRPRLCENVEP